MIYLDSWIFLEFFSESIKWAECGRIIEGKSKKVISTIVLMELKYRGIKKFGAKKTRDILHSIKGSESIVMVDVTKEIAELAADLRVKYYNETKRAVSYADMINLATAIMIGCESFYSGDQDFRNIEEIKTVIV